MCFYFGERDHILQIKKPLSCCNNIANPPKHIEYFKLYMYNALHILDIEQHFYLYVLWNMLLSSSSSFFWHALNFFCGVTGKIQHTFNATTQRQPSKKEHFVWRWFMDKYIESCICITCESIKKLQSSGILFIKSACTYCTKTSNHFMILQINSKIDNKITRWCTALGTNVHASVNPNVFFWGKKFTCIIWKRRCVNIEKKQHVTHIVIILYC